MPGVKVFVTGDRARPVVAALRRLKAQHGLVNALTHEMNVVLRGAGRRGTIHPNRIHTLLSGNPVGSLNPKTFALIEATVALLDARFTEVTEGRQELNHGDWCQS